MKNYFIVTLALVALLLCGCKKNSKTDPESETTDNGERDYVVRIYVNSDVMEYINNDIYLTLPGQEEVKLKLENPQELDSKADMVALFQINERRVDPSIFKVYGLTFKGTKGTAVLRYDYSVKSVDSIPDEINLGCGYSLGGYMPGTDIARGQGCQVLYTKGLKKENYEKTLSTINSMEKSVEVY